ncbi:MAG: hypothetical protein HFI52_06040 [Lachnospiraceae bacterium]|nr:hypothetical protein [Lachnospiraceae bacterium]
MLQMERKKKTRKAHTDSGALRKRGMMAAILLAVTTALCVGNRNSGKMWTMPGGPAEKTESTEQESGRMAEPEDKSPGLLFEKADAKVMEALETAGAQKAFGEQKASGEQKALEEKGEPAGSFQVAYEGCVSEYPIEFAHCDCVYDAEGIQIYAEYLYWLMVPESFPYNQYVLYIRTPREEFQLYPVKDFLVDKAHGILYTKIVGNDGFEKVKSLPFTEENGSVLTLEKVVFDAEAAEKMLCDAHDRTEEKEAAGGEALFSNITVELTEMDAYGTGILNGEVGGIEKSTGKKYYVNWKNNPKSGSLTAEPYILKQYDPIKDKEEFAACSEVFDEIEQGDWSRVRPVEEQYLWGMDAEEWIRLDVNGDGMPELLGGWSWTIDDLPENENNVKRVVSSVFAYRDGMAELVYVDVNDGMEYFFVTADGAFIYEWGVSGWPCTNVFRKSRFDEKWNVEYLDTIVRYRFEEYEEEQTAHFQEAYPDTYGVGGSGVYYLRERPKTEEELKENQDGKYVVREYLTEEAFLEMFEDWTGWDFYQAQMMY